MLLHLTVIQGHGTEFTSWLALVRCLLLPFHDLLTPAREDPWPNRGPQVERSRANSGLSTVFLNRPAVFPKQNHPFNKLLIQSDVSVAENAHITVSSLRTTNHVAREAWQKVKSGRVFVRLLDDLPNEARGRR